MGYYREEHKAILERHGWEVECEDPFEIRHEESGSFATVLAAVAVVRGLKEDEENDRYQRYEVDVGVPPVPPD